MNRKLISVIFLVLIFGICTRAQNIKSNPYGLDIVQTISQYDSCLTINKSNQLVDIEKFIPGIVLDIRYASTNNFTHQIIYSKPMAFLRLPAAEALKMVQKELSKQKIGLKIYDAYRPYQATMKFYEVMPDSNFCANPKYGSRHNRGCAVDVSLVYLSTGKELEMPTGYDDFTVKANPNDTDVSKIVSNNRSRLIKVMSKYGFTVFPTEWWHFDYQDWKNFKLMDISFEELEKGK
ncbi:MAG: M15 family metallopeptidase [bacterium]